MLSPDERSAVQAELRHLGATDKAGGIDTTGSLKANTLSAIGEAVRSLAEDEEHLLTLMPFLRRCIGTFRPPMPRVSQEM
jgi:hypothetical protein